MRVDIVPESFRVALDLRGVSHSEGGHRRLINLVRELDAIPSPLEFDLISNPCHEIDSHSWSIRTHTIPPRLRTRMMHHPGVGSLRKVLWGKTRIMHFLTGDIWYSPTCRTVVTIHDLAPLHFPEFSFASKAEEQQYHRHLKLIIEKADVIHAVSEHTLKDLKQHFPHGAAKFRLIHPAPDPFFMPEDWGLEDRALFRYNIGSPRGFLLSVGGFNGWKNPGFLLEAYHHYRKGQKDPRKLVIAGDPHKPYPGLPTLYEAVCRLNLQQDVILLGRVSDSFLRKVYCSASLFLYPSKLDGFGYSVLEAMACGCPVLCSNETALPETVGEAAQQLPVSDPQMWADAIPPLLTNRAARVELVEKGFQQAAGYDWKATAEQVLQIYLDLLK